MRTAQDGGQSNSENKETASGASPWDVMSDVTQEDLLPGRGHRMALGTSGKLRFLSLFSCILLLVFQDKSFTL